MSASTRSSPTRTSTRSAVSCSVSSAARSEPGDDVSFNGLRFDVLEVEGSRIEKIAVEFVERPGPRRGAEDLLRDDDELE